MTKRVTKRLPEVRTLYEILPRGTEGGKEFARIVDLLLFHEARRKGKKISIFSDAAGDYHGLDSFEGDSFRTEGTTGYQYKFYPSPLSPSHRSEIIESLKKASAKSKKIKLNKWILVTPQDLTESSTRKDFGDVTWFENLRTGLGLDFETEHWGHKKLISLFLETPALCLFYYPELTSDGESRRTIEDTRKRYNDNLTTLYRNIEFVGMSVYKQEAVRGVPIEHIYIPVTAVPEIAAEGENNVPRIDPLKFLAPTAKTVILGDPGSGKSTLLRFLSLVGTSRALQKRSGAKSDKRLPILITLRSYADELKTRKNLSLIDYIQESTQGSFNLKSADLRFFEYYLETGQAILLFDGLDELPNSNFKQTVRDRIRTLTTTYPGNTVVVSSRIVGYENPLRFEDAEFGHYRLTKLQLAEMERFVKDWYQARIENVQEREANAEDLIRILRNEDHTAIRELAENPLLLTIVALVHRIDAVLPDERVVLYVKCTETLLNTWHSWKYKGAEVKNRGREERRNRRRMEAIAQWMHKQSLGTGKEQRAIVPYDELHGFLTKYLTEVERPYDVDSDPEDIATEFLEFVKKRAGLLIEVGDERYSFVHQTFQEYLTSAFIITSNELKGVTGIWRDISPYCDDPRWVEVIRLLIAGLQSNASQQVLIAKLLNRKGARTSTVKSQLLGGLLLDGVEPAEIRSREVLEQVLESTIASDENQLRSLLTILRTWISKGNGNKDGLVELINSLWQEGSDGKHNLKLILTVSALELDIDIKSKINLISSAEDREYNLMNLFLITNPPQINFTSLEKDYKGLWELQKELITESALGNFFATAFQALNTPLPPVISSRRLFEEQLVVLGMLPMSGPFTHYNLNCFSITAGTQDCDDNLIIDEKNCLLPAPFASSRLNFLSAAMHAISSVYSERDKALTPSKSSKKVRHAKASKQDTNLKHILNNVRRAASMLRNIAVSSHSGSAVTMGECRESWSKVLSVPSFYATMADSICITFNLKPYRHWWEALKVCFIPNIPYRLEILRKSTYEKIQNDFLSGNPDEESVYLAAWLLIFDCWLYSRTYHDSPDMSQFSKLADLTQTSSALPLRFTHCIRDLTYGTSDRKEDLISILDSDKEMFRSLLAGIKQGRPHRVPTTTKHVAKKPLKSKTIRVK